MKTILIVLSNILMIGATVSIIRHELDWATLLGVLSIMGTIRAEVIK